MVERHNIPTSTKCPSTPLQQLKRNTSLELFHLSNTIHKKKQQVLHKLPSSSQTRYLDLLPNSYKVSATYIPIHKNTQINVKQLIRPRNHIFIKINKQCTKEKTWVLQNPKFESEWLYNSITELKNSASKTPQLLVGMKERYENVYTNREN